MHLLTRLVLYAKISIFTYLGVLCRVCLQFLSEFTPKNSSLISLGSNFYLPNIFGCFIMGLCHGLTISGSLHNFSKNLFLAISVGFCGSCTTFSGWQKSVTFHLVYNLDFTTALNQLLVGFTMSYCSFLFGLHCAEWVLADPVIKPSTLKNTLKIDDDSPKISFLSNFTIYGTFVLFTTILWILVLALKMNFLRKWSVSAVLGPFGSLLRYEVSKLNGKFTKIPLFTFLTNFFGSLIAICIFIIQRHLEKSVYNEKLDFWMNYGVSIGILGSLTTVSTFIKEIYLQEKSNYRSMAYFYGLGTILSTQAVCITMAIIFFV